MTNMSGSEWQQQELERFMAKHADDPSRKHLSVKLSNPNEERELDEVILHELWPGVVQALRGSRLTTWIGATNTPAEALETLHHQHITRALTFLIEDPARPIMPGASRPWYCRFVLRASVLGYMLSKTTLLVFPADFSMRKLTRLLREPLMQGCPPQLSWTKPFEGAGTYQVALETGEGAGWGTSEQGGGKGVPPEDGRGSSRDHRSHGAAGARLERHEGVQHPVRSRRRGESGLLRQTDLMSRSNRRASRTPCGTRFRSAWMQTPSRPLRGRSRKQCTASRCTSSPPRECGHAGRVAGGGCFAHRPGCPP